MLDRAQALTTEAREVGDAFAEMLALAALVAAALACGRWDEAWNANSRAAELAGEHERRYRLTVAANMAATIRGLEGWLSEARALFAEAKQRDPGYRETGHLDAEAITCVMGGDFGAALGAARESANASPGARLRRVGGMLFGAFAAIELGLTDEAVQHLDRARGVLRGRHWQWYLPVSHHAAGLLNWSQGRLDAALEELRPAADRLQETNLNPFAAPALLDLAELCAELGDAAGSGEAAEQLANVSAQAQRERFTAMADLAEAWAALAAGETPAAAAAAGKGLELLASIDCPILLARGHYVLGRALASTAPAEAAAAFDEAARAFERCGAVWRRGQVVAAMRRTGSSGRRVLAAARGPNSLTRREREVARLGAQGKSAKEIATALFVGERTVETHLGNVYAKLGVESKMDLVRRAAELGLV
jgi:DNA-binding CsgD family transcriptional regulator